MVLPLFVWRNYRRIVACVFDLHHIQPMLLIIDINVCASSPKFVLNPPIYSLIWIHICRTNHISRNTDLIIQNANLIICRSSEFRIKLVSPNLHASRTYRPCILIGQ